MTHKQIIAELVRIWHSPHLDLSLKAGLAEAIEALNGADGDLISRQAALDAIMGEPTDAHYPSWYARKIKLLPSAGPKTGAWNNTFDGNEWYWYCSECKAQYYEDDLWMGGNDFPNYCPNCGADMRGEK